MLDKIKEKINKIEKAAGLEVILLPDNRYSVLLTVLCFSKKSIVIEKKEEIKEGNFEELKSIIEKDIPIYLIINGRGILHKKIQDSGTDITQLVHAVLPNAKVQEFYVQSIVSSKSTLISIVRKEVIDPILAQLKNNGYFCIGLSLGGAVTSSVLLLIDNSQKMNTVQWAGHSILVDEEGTVVDYKVNPNISENSIFSLDTEKIEEQFLLSYSAAFSILTNQEPVKSFVEFVSKSKEEYLNKVLFKKFSISVLLFFFVVLMVNFILFANFSSKNGELSQKESKYSAMFSEMENLSKEVQEKESFLTNAGWLESSSMSYYADRIASTVPSSVKLTELTINPVDERKSREEKKTLFTTGLILVKGDCAKPTELNEWLEKVKAIDRVGKAKLVHYSFDPKDNKGSFSIEIETSN